MISTTGLFGALRRPQPAEAGDDVATFRNLKRAYRAAVSPQRAREALAAMFAIVNERRMRTARRWLDALRGEIGKSARLDRELIEAALGSGDAALALDLLQQGLEPLGFICVIPPLQRP